VRSGTAKTLGGKRIRLGGKRIRLTVQHFAGRIDATLFLVRDSPPRMLRDVVQRDAQGRVVARVKR
jgi:starvation-inducible outer membrane lipoprotein